jgi:hypothetical protein
VETTGSIKHNKGVSKKVRQKINFSNLRNRKMKKKLFWGQLISVRFFLAVF